MNERVIRKPKGPAVMFLIEAITGFFSILSIIAMTLIPQISGNTETVSASGIFRLVLLGIINLFMSIVLFSKKYNNTLLVASGVLLISSISGLFLNITPYNVSDIIFYLLLIAFTYIMVKMPETSLRQKAAKLRFVIPVFKFVLILISTVQTIQRLYENLTEAMGAYPDGAVNTAIILLPSILGAIFSFLPVLCYALLVNWLADPYEKQN